MPTRTILENYTKVGKEYLPCVDEWCDTFVPNKEQPYYKFIYEKNGKRYESSAHKGEYSGFRYIMLKFLFWLKTKLS